MDPRPRLFLIDGSSQMYRAYHAMRGGGLSGPGGKTTHAVYIFVTMLRKLMEDHHPQYIAASFDLPGRTFRSDLAADYKATRSPMPPDLAEQIPWVHEACEALGVPILTYERYEADDVIGTLAAKAIAAGFEVAIVTGDKDFFQLVHDGLKVYNPKDDGTWYDAEGVKEKFGVLPEQVVDVLALMGDSIDNIKGVPGIGEKGAHDLIATYGNLEALLAHAPEITNKRYREGLLNHADDARQSRELARIRIDVPVDFDPDAVRYRGASRAACFELFTRLGFRTLVMEYAPTADTVGKDYAIVDTTEGLASLVAELETAGRFAFRVIPDAPSAMRAGIVGFSFSTAARRARYVPISSSALKGSAAAASDGGLFAPDQPEEQPGLPGSAVLDGLKRLLEDPSVAKVGHDLKFDAIVLARHGVELRGIETDTMLASYLVDATRSSHPLEELALEHAGYKALKDEDLCGRGAKAISFADVPLDRMLDYAGERADLALQMAGPLRELLRREELEELYQTFELPLVPVLVAIERAGVRIDGPTLLSQSGNVDKELARRAAQIYEYAGEEFNINSPKKLSEILFDKLGMRTETIRRTTKTKAQSTSFEVLEELALGHELPRLILEWRALMKLKGTYIDALPQLVDPETGRVHTCFNQAVAATGTVEQQRPEPAEHSDPNRGRTRDPPCVRCRAGQRPDLGRLLADRAARAGAHVGRADVDRGLQPERRHSRSHRRQGVWRDEQSLGARTPPARQDHQLRAALRQAGVHACEGHRRVAAGSAGFHRRLLRGLSGRSPVHRRPAGQGARIGRGQDHVRPATPGPRVDEPQRPDPGCRRAGGGQPADPGQRRRHPEKGNDRRPRRTAVRRRGPRAHDPDRSR